MNDRATIPARNEFKVKGFQGWGVLCMNRTHVGLVLHVEHARIGFGGFFSEHRDAVLMIDTSDIKHFVPLSVRVAVEGTIDEHHNVHATYIEPDDVGGRDPSTSSSLDATMQTARYDKENAVDAQQVKMSQQDLDEKTHADFKQGLRHGMNLAIRFLQRAAMRHFQEQKDGEAKLLRDLAGCLEEEKDTQRKTDYRVRPHID
jgi:hypothetical protein